MGTNNIISGLKQEEYYKKIFEIDSVSGVNNLHQNCIDTLRKDYPHIQPSEILISMNYMTEANYIKMFDGIIDMASSEQIKENISMIDLFDIPEVNIDVSRKDVVNTIQRLIDQFRLIPVGHINNNHGILCYVIAEPKHIPPDSNSVGDNYINLEYLSQIVSSVTRVFKSVRSKFFIVPLLSFYDIVETFNKQNKVNLSHRDRWKPTEEQIAYKLIVDGIIQKASDIFFWGERDGIAYGYSILNDYVYKGVYPLSIDGIKAFETAIFRMAAVDRDTAVKNIVRDYDISDLGRLKEYKGRLNILPNRICSSINIRVLDINKTEIPFSKLKIRDVVKEKKKIILNNKHGIYLVAGATGSGKSTTLHSELGYIRDTRPGDRIETVEKPIEHELNGICQIGLETNSDINEMDVLKSLTRRNAQVLNIGEINSPELVRFAVNSALMNLFVVSTIHTTNVASIPDRILGFCDSTGDRSAFTQFLSNVKGLSHQTMLKEICPRCKEWININNSSLITSNMIDILKHYGYDSDKVLIAKKDTNCPICHGRGFLVTNPIICVEVLVVTDKISKTFRKHNPIDLSTYIDNVLMENQLTGVHDAIRYMIDEKLSFLDIWNNFSLYNKVDFWLKDESVEERMSNIMRR